MNLRTFKHGPFLERIVSLGFIIGTWFQQDVLPTVLKDASAGVCVRERMGKSIYRVETYTPQIPKSAAASGFVSHPIRLEKSSKPEGSTSKTWFFVDRLSSGFMNRSPKRIR